MTNNSNTYVIKIGGKFFDFFTTNTSVCDGFFDFIQLLLNEGKKVVVVHGGGDQVQQLLSALGKKSEKHNGLRITPAEDIGLVTGILAGDLNKLLAAKLQAASIDALGLSLADAEIAICEPIDNKLGRVGQPAKGDSRLLSLLINQNFVPVIASIGRYSSGDLCNVNADHAAIHIANMLGAQLIFLSDVRGVLDADGNLISSLDENEINRLSEQQVITDGMLVKVNAALSAANTLNNKVTIASWHDLGSDTKNQSIGTSILPTKH
ncbi:acetylglutamate kinase [Glaciecola sp. 1036]|uniref:acetylglutamate kinase n=1 Tax=Alteromonadaceae TaxID=72275 RepID=UPI003D023D30